MEHTSVQNFAQIRPDAHLHMKISPQIRPTLHILMGGLSGVLPVSRAPIPAHRENPPTLI